MIKVEENSAFMIREHNTDLVKRILSEKFILGFFRPTRNGSGYEVNIYKLYFFILPCLVGSLYPADNTGELKYLVIKGDPETFKESAEKLEANGFDVTIQKPIDSRRN
jgi:hypothetical protein